MELDDLKIVWRREMEMSVSSAELSWDAIKQNVSEVRRSVRLRDFWVVLVLLFWAVTSVLSTELSGWLSTLSLALVLGTTGFLIYVLIGVRAVASTDDWTLSSRLASEIQRLEKQAKVVKGFGSWYLLPMFFAVISTALAGFHERTGNYIPGLNFWIYSAICAVVFGGTMWLHRREARTKIQPLLTRLKELQRELMD
ncbi:MAG: hypothetical protein ACREQ8_18535 [Woeseiaceae bacterium]